MRVLILALALAACAPASEAPEQTEAPAPVAEAQSAESNMAAMPPWSEARAAGVDFRGVGQEPGWMIDIYQQNRILLLLDYGESLTEFPLPTPTYPQEGATRYETQTDAHTLSVTIRRFPCEDVMSGEAFPASIEINIDGRTLTGCGRSV